MRPCRTAPTIPWVRSPSPTTSGSTSSSTWPRSCTRSTRRRASPRPACCAGWCSAASSAARAARASTTTGRRRPYRTTRCSSDPADALPVAIGTILRQAQRVHRYADLAVLDLVGISSPGAEAFVRRVLDPLTPNGHRTYLETLAPPLAERLPRQGRRGRPLRPSPHADLSPTAPVRARPGGSAMRELRDGVDEHQVEEQLDAGDADRAGMLGGRASGPSPA